MEAFLRRASVQQLESLRERCEYEKALRNQWLKQRARLYERLKDRPIPTLDTYDMGIPYLDEND